MPPNPLRYKRYISDFASNPVFGLSPRGFIFILPCLLLIPVLYYSLTTPFALVDDYGMCYYAEYLNSLKRFSRWAEKQFLNYGQGRYRPFFDLYNMVTWKLFGPIPWLHHLSRWIIHFGSLAFFSAAFLCFQQKISDRSRKKKNTGSILPLSFLVYIWIFFPNSPVSRLGPQEIYTVFFLGLCNWMMALLILRDGKGGAKTQSLAIIFFVFYISYLGLSFSKEINIAVMLWILVFYYFRLAVDFDWKKVFYGLPLLIVFSYSLLRVYSASKGNYGIVSVTSDLIKENSIWVFRELFQVDTSVVITVFFIFLFLLFFLFVGAKIIRRGFSTEVVFSIFLLGQFVSLFLIICTSWAQVLRYWYPLVPIFTTLLTFTVKFLLEATRERFDVFTNSIKIALAGFIVFFIGCNYYNYLTQTIIQHSLRHAEAKLIAELSDLHSKNEYVQILKIKGDPEAELVYHLIDYYRRFSPRFFAIKYKIYTSSPRLDNRRYFMVTMHNQAENLQKYLTITNNREYDILSLTKKVSSSFQRTKEPYLSRDAGAHPMNKYQWIIYSNRT